MLESKIETYFQNQIDKSGGMYFKFRSPSMRGVPDQIVLYEGSVYFVELKAPGENPRKSQLEVHRTMKEHGVDVHTIDTKEGVNRFITDILGTKPKKKQKETFKIKDNLFDL